MSLMLSHYQQTVLGDEGIIGAKMDVLWYSLRHIWDMWTRD